MQAHFLPPQIFAYLLANVRIHCETILNGYKSHMYVTGHLEA